jgi:TolA-binding protein
MTSADRLRSPRALAAALLVVLLLATPARPQRPMPADQVADLVLNSARKAYNEKNFTFAAERFREFLAKHGGSPDAPAARHGLARCLLEGQPKNYAGAVEQLQPLAGNQDFAEHPFVLADLGVAERGLGLADLAEAAVKPAEAPQRRAAAIGHFAAAAKWFAAAAEAFHARAGKPVATVKELPADFERAARARCDQAEMELRQSRAKEAQAVAAPFLKDAVLARSRYRPLGLYLHGYASFLLGDHLTAGRSLNSAKPFADPTFGPHARYLLGRVYQAGGELPEAAAEYEGVLTDYAKQKKDAAVSLKNPGQFKDRPDERQRLEALVKGPPPEPVARAAFYAACLQYEAGRFGDALARFAAFAKEYPDSSLIPEALLRVGYCQVQLKQYAEAQNTLRPLAEKQPRLADQALLWTAKAQAAAADPAKPTPALTAAAATLRQAADKAQQQSAADPEAKQRRAEILVELADVQSSAKQAKEAAGLYEQLLSERALPQRSEELTQRLADALHLAGDFARSDQVCERFLRENPRSPLCAAVSFRHAENTYFAALAAEKDPAESAKLFDEAAKRYRVVVEKYPEFERAHLARLGLALACYRKADYEGAQQALEAVPAPDRTGELALVPYLLADCLIRQAPARADDALAAGKLQEQLLNAVQLLDAFVGAQPRSSEAPDALLKLGHCQQRLAALLAEPPAKTAALQAARAAYEKLLQQFPNDRLVPQARLERAKVLYAANDKGGAIGELRRFTGDPLQNAPVAPLAVIQLATYLRELNKADEAANVLAACRKKHEDQLAKDAERATWVPLLRYHHGVALLEARKPGEARALFEQVVAQSPGKPVAAEAALRAGQCRSQEARKLIDAAGGKPTEEALGHLRETARYLDNKADEFKGTLPQSEARARMIYESAWASRLAGEAEVAAVRTKIQRDQEKKLLEEALNKQPPGAKLPPVSVPPVPRSAVPVQPDEQKARAAYESLLSQFPDLPLAVEARLELAELLDERGEHDIAIQRLTEALDKEPPQELTDRLRLRLGSCLAAKKDLTKALAQFDAVARDPKNPLAGQAHYRAGECLLQLGDPAKAAARLAVFRDQDPFRNMPGLTDRALLRLGHALAQVKQWDASRRTLEQTIGRFGNSPWVLEARYGVGWAYQNQRQFDAAVQNYSQVVNATVSELGAKAQLQTGLCRLEQKRYPEATAALLVVPWTYDYPELNPIALCEAARSLIEARQPEQAEKLLQRVVRDYPTSEWAKVARERLDGLRKQ